MKKIYLRQISTPTSVGIDEKLDIWVGDDMKADKEYWQTYHGCKTRYFEIKEVMVK